MSTGAVMKPFPGRWVHEALPPEAPYLIEGLLPDRGTAGIIGESNVGKSALGLEIAASMITGEPLWGYLKPTKRLDRVAYVLGEHSERVIRRLFRHMWPNLRDRKAIGRHLWLIGPEDILPSRAIIAGGQVQQALVERLVLSVQGAGLVIWDPLAGFLSGVTEADNVTMRRAVETLGDISMRANAACLILAHMGKPQMGPEGVEYRRRTYAMRGASSQEDALTHIFYLVHGSKPSRYDLEVRKLKGHDPRGVFRLERNERVRHRLLNP